MSVSPWINFTRATGTHNSSATSWVWAVNMPWPRSTLPVCAVTVPSAATASQESSCFGSMWEAWVSNGPCACAALKLLKLTMRAPPVARNSRRETMGIPPDGAHHAVVGVAAAEHAAEGGADLLVRCAGIGVEDGFSGEDHATEAVAALGGAFIDEGLLDGVGLFG